MDAEPKKPQINAHSAAGLRCPLCGGPLLSLPGALRCAAGHSFDLARQGYANLLPVQKKHAREPGDSAEMVAARHRFLQAGFYRPFADELARLCARYAGDAPHIVDAGCGEGSYAAAVWQALAGRDPALVAFDLSRPAVKLAARALPDAACVVAGSFAAPVRSGWADVVLNVFSPFARQEFWRILRPGGVLLYAVPTARHLFRLKQALYSRPYQNPEREVEYPGFAPLQTTVVEGQITVPGPLVQDLFAMTPYFWRTPPGAAQALAGLNSLSTEIGFRFLALQKRSAPDE